MQIFLEEGNPIISLWIMQTRQLPSPHQIHKRDDYHKSDATHHQSSVI